MGTRASSSEETPRAGTLAAEEFRAALDRALSLADSDERVGPLIAATKLRMKFVFPDLGLVLNLAAGGDAERNLRWSFAEVDWSPQLELEMDGDTGNRFLQGTESLAVAIARGRARAKGESRNALLALPAARLLVEPYRQVVTREHPTLVA
jgi:hypothetical protein